MYHYWAGPSRTAWFYRHLSLYPNRCCSGDKADRAIHEYGIRDLLHDRLSSWDFTVGVPDLPDDILDEDVVELARVAKIFNLPRLETICSNLQTEQEFLNPSIGTFLNDETGQRVKQLFLNQATLADVIFEFNGNLAFLFDVGEEQCYGRSRPKKVTPGMHVVRKIFTCTRICLYTLYSSSYIVSLIIIPRE